MESKIFLNLTEKILLETGIIVEKIQYSTVQKFILEKSRLKNITEEEVVKNILLDKAEFEQLVGAVTINETYFFREEKQFLFLKDVLFPKFYGKKIKIWSAACSTGEEAFSLLALSLEMGLDAEIYATDIDFTALEKLKNGVFTKNSFRIDGKMFHPLIEKHGKFNGEGKFIFDRDFVSRIKTVNYNLMSRELPSFAFDVDLVFLRNVFIYFGEDSRVKVFNKIASTLSEDGCLFFSMNEVGCISDGIVPDFMMRQRENYVFYFKRTCRKQQKAENTENKKEKSENENKNQFLRQSLRKNVHRDFLEKKECRNKGILMAEINEKILRLVNEGKFDEAEKTARLLSEDVSTKAFSYFYHGYIHYNLDDRQKAESLFETCRLLKPDFWPAHFFHGLVLKDIGKDENAKKSFFKCRELLQNGGDDYSFFLDSFSPAYIASICEKFLT